MPALLFDLDSAPSLGDARTAPITGTSKVSQHGSGKLVASRRSLDDDGGDGGDGGGDGDPRRR